MISKAGNRQNDVIDGSRTQSLPANMVKRPWIPRKSIRTGFSFDRTNVEDISTVIRIPITVDLKIEGVSSLGVHT